eukprot:COSAG02_NODE_796_length_17128_cov_176.587586_2_plen_163_part_00
MQRGERVHVERADLSFQKLRRLSRGLSRARAYRMQRAPSATSSNIALTVPKWPILVPRRDNTRTPVDLSPRTACCTNQRRSKCVGSVLLSVGIIIETEPRQNHAGSQVTHRSRAKRCTQAPTDRPAVASCAARRGNTHQSCVEQPGAGNSRLPHDPSDPSDR